MPFIRRNLLIRTLFGGMALLLASAYFYGLRQPAPSPAPDITLVTLNGANIALRKLRGQPVLINFWSTGCDQCMRDIPQLIALYRAAQTQRLIIIAVAMPYDRPDYVQAVSKAKQLPYPVALDIDGIAARAFGGVQLTPTFFLIAPDGRIVYQASGELNKKKVQNMIETMRTPADDIQLPKGTS